MSEAEDRPTPEMIEAGVIALEMYSGAFSESHLAETVYVAMRDRRLRAIRENFEFDRFRKGL